MRVINKRVPTYLNSKHCDKEFEVYSDDGGGDFTVCWNWCPHCNEKVDIWIRFLLPHEASQPGGVKQGITCRQSMANKREGSVGIIEPWNKKGVDWNNKD